LPEKLKRCVEHVKDQGKSEDSAWAICVDSTGLKPHKKKKKDVKKSKGFKDSWDNYEKSKLTQFKREDEERETRDAEHRKRKKEVGKAWDKHQIRKYGWESGPPDPPTRKQIEAERRRKFCEDCGQKRPCQCDKDAMDHVAQQMEEEYKNEGMGKSWDEYQLEKAWNEYIEKEWKPYKEWIKDKEEAKNAPKKKKPEKKDKPWKAKK
jgi:hypothetical protein